MKALLASICLFLPAIVGAASEGDCSSRLSQEGRGQPQYVGKAGYVVPNQYSLPPGYGDALPEYPWRVHLLKQVGPRLWGIGDETLEAKTPARVKAQYLKHEGYGRYTGMLDVELDDGRTVTIDADDFTLAPYWKCSPHVAAEHGVFIAEIQPGTRPVSRGGMWIEVGRERRVFCTGTSRSKGVTNGVMCYMYKSYSRGARGQQWIFPSTGLKIVY